MPLRVRCWQAFGIGVLRTPAFALEFLPTGSLAWTTSVAISDVLGLVVLYVHFASSGQAIGKYVSMENARPLANEALLVKRKLEGNSKVRGVHTESLTTPVSVHYHP